MKKMLILLAIVSMVSSIASAQLAGYWKFDETSGTTVLDSSGNGKTGTFYSENSSNYPTRIAGHSGNAILFNANTTDTTNYNKINVPLISSDALTNLGEAFTISMWVRREGVGTISHQPGLVRTDAYEVDLATDPNATESTDGQDTFWSDLTIDWQYLWLDYETTEQKTLGNWYLLTITYDGNYLRKYINGEMVSGIPAPTTFSLAASTELSIGARASNGYLIGALDDVAIWSGKYLSSAEVLKLANGTTTPLTAVESNPQAAITTYTMEPALYTEGGAAILSPTMSQDMSIVSNQITYFGNQILNMPGDKSAATPWGWLFKYSADYSAVPEDRSLRGVEWIEPSWSGKDASVAVVAAFLKPGMILGQVNSYYEPYNPTLYPWLNKPYFKTKMRVASKNNNGARVRVAIYRRSSDVLPDSSNYNTLLTLLDEVEFPLVDNVWQDLNLLLPKTADTSAVPVWFEISIVGGTSDTVLYVDEFKPAYNVAATFDSLNFNEDTFIDYGDLAYITNDWLESAGATFLDPRSGGLLVNGDFSADKGVLKGTDSRVYMNPTGWTFTGTVANNYGIQQVDNRGEFNFTWLHTPTLPAVVTPVGGIAAAYLTDKYANDQYGVLEQTTTATAVAGQTYYAMAYVMTNTWNAWKDVARMDLSIDGVVKASAGRVLSRNKWRAIYCTYTATSADAAKPLKISLSYQDLTFDSAATGCMLVGNVYLGTTMPSDWPEKRPNLLVNGGFEDLTEANSVSTTDYPLYRYLTAADNYGKWFTSAIHPTIPGWVYEIPTGFDFNNKAGMWGTGYFGSPLPSPGSLTSVAVMIDNNLKLGQVVGPLVAGTPYYLDAACCIWSETYTASYWPNPAPVIRLELWRIPAGVTDGTVIYNAIVAGNTNYVKVAEAAVSATGNVKALGGEVQSKWQIIGTTYTATSLDTNMYVRIRGTGGFSSTPEYAFSDVYLSTAKRDIPGGAVTFNLSSGLQYNVIGPYDCVHAGVMGYTIPEYDLNTDCIVNFGDFAIFAEKWLAVGFN
jgi:hypothetical protein